MSNLILIAEDEPKIASLVRDYLTSSGFEAIVVDDGDRVVEELRSNNPALLLLDLMLPNKDGFDICKEVRAFSKVPIIMMTARVEEIDRLLGLELGADDYICKPFSPREVVARVKATLRRASWMEADNPGGPVQIDEAKMLALVNTTRLDLTPVEFRLLHALASHPGQVYSREQLMDRAYKDHRVVSERTIDSHVKNLRRKIQTADSSLDPISSVYGVGYRFEL